jgi:phasin
MADSKLEVPAELRELAEKTIDQAERAFELFFDAATKSMAALPGAGTEVSKQALSLTEQNLKAAFEHARKLVHATDLQEAMRIQSEFLRTQFTKACPVLLLASRSLRHDFQLGLSSNFRQ